MEEAGGYCDGYYFLFGVIMGGLFSAVVTFFLRVGL